MSSLRRTVAVLLTSLALACTPAALPRASTTPRLTTAAGAVRRVLVMTDLEDVRDVAVVGATTYVASDEGILVYGADGESPRRITRADGLPSDDVTALGVERDGSLLVATAGGLAVLRGESATPVEGLPAHGRPTDLLVRPDGTAWLCTLDGLLRRDGSTWAPVGEPVQCTATALSSDDGTLWVGTTNGVLEVVPAGAGEPPVVRSHGLAAGLPEPYVRALVPVAPGQVLALVQGAQRAQLALWDGAQWAGYTIPGVEEPAIGLALREGRPTLLTRERAFTIAPRGEGIQLRALVVNPGRPTTGASAPTPATAATGASALRPPRPLAEPRATGVRALELLAIPIALELPPAMDRAIQAGDRVFAAVANGGVVEVGAGARALRSRSLVPDGDLQTATEARGGVWIRARDGRIAKWVEGRLRRLALPDDIVPQSIASGPRGAYLAALTPGSRALRIFVSESGAWRPLLERTLDVTPAAVPALAVDPQGRIWAAITAPRESGQGSRPYGVVVIDPGAGDGFTHHHRGAVQGRGLPIPDEVSAITFDGEGRAWLATLNGATRIDEHQAIVFDETRGVRGEVVTDVASGRGQMWIAAAEGLGSYAERLFDFHQPAIVRDHRPTALATDAAGHLWAAGGSGVLQHDGAEWRHLGTPDGLPTESYADVEVDGADRVWLLTGDAVVVLAPE